MSKMPVSPNRTILAAVAVFMVGGVFGGWLSLVGDSLLVVMVLFALINSLRPRFEG